MRVRNGMDGPNGGDRILALYAAAAEAPDPSPA